MLSETATKSQRQISVWHSAILWAMEVFHRQHVDVLIPLSNLQTYRGELTPIFIICVVPVQYMHQCQQSSICLICWVHSLCSTE